MKTAFIISAVLAFSSAAVCQTTWYIPDDFPAGIQAALDSPSVVNGDTVIVRPGLYVENIDFKGKAVTLKSLAGPEVTIIDGRNGVYPVPGTTVLFRTDEGRDSVLSGFSITNGTGCENGPGIFTEGGGICCNDASPTIEGNIITGNSVFGYFGSGGGISVTGFWGSSPLIRGNTIKSNIAQVRGGGIFVGELASPEITGNTILGNTAIELGGGIALFGTSAEVYDNHIMNNITEDGGFGGAGIACSFTRDPPLIANNVIAGNTAKGALGEGGGIRCEESSPDVINCTLVGNTAEGDGTTGFGGAVMCMEKSHPRIFNSIIRDNHNPLGYEVAVTTTSVLTIAKTNLDGGIPQVYVEPNSLLVWGAGMIDADPLFVNAVQRDYHLTWNSPCRNTGGNSLVGTLTADFEGDPRIAGGVVDMGADEFYYHLYHRGNAVPGGVIKLKAAGPPGLAPVWLAIDTVILDPLQSTAYGDLYLAFPPLHRFDLGTIPPDGVLVRTIRLPQSWIPGSTKYLQALVGPLGGYSSRLTNPVVLTIE